MLDEPPNGDGFIENTAILVALDFGDPDTDASLEELRRLTESAGVMPVGVIQGRRSRPDAAYFAGSGKVVEIAEATHARQAEVVIFNHDLSPAQQRNLESKIKRRVVDRTSLILDIFAQRAQSHEGKVQVELAQLERLSTRLVRGWTHLERQKGGVGLRGPGETQFKLTAGSLASASSHSRHAWLNWVNNARRNAVAATAMRYFPFRLWATPMRGNPPYLIV